MLSISVSAKAGVAARVKAASNGKATPSAAHHPEAEKGHFLG